MRLYRPVCVTPGRKPRRPVFSRHGSYTVTNRFEVTMLKIEGFLQTRAQRPSDRVLTSNPESLRVVFVSKAEQWPSGRVLTSNPESLRVVFVSKAEQWPSGRVLTPETLSVVFLSKT